jgi:methylmalonyl-CoA/ethylmalonyl-CoA epimerase
MASAIEAEIAAEAGVQFVDHVAIAVARGELEQQVEAYKLMGFREVHREEVHGRDQVREVLLQIGEGPNLIQLLEPLSADSPVQKTVERNSGRPGVAHIAFRVENAARAYAAMVAKGFRMIDAAPRPGSRGTTVFFVHPKSREDVPFGILLEMVEDKGQRDKGTEGQRDRGTKGQRDKGTEGQRDRGIKGRRERGTKGQRD